MLGTMDRIAPRAEPTTTGAATGAGAGGPGAGAAGEGAPGAGLSGGGVAGWRPPAGSPVQPAFWGPVDDAYNRLLAQQQHVDRDPWLLVQTVGTAVARRAVHGALGVQAGWRVLDVGTGFGPLAVELGGAFGCRVLGVDIDPDALVPTASLRADLERAGWLGPHAQGGDGTVSLAAADATRLPVPDGAFDAVTARFLLQHLPDPVAAVAELVRAVRPGGVVCVVDADDGLSISHPEPPEPIRRLLDAYVQAQHARGGDRLIGRKLAGLLDAAGVAVASVLVLPQAAYGSAPPDGLSQRLLHHRMAAFAGEIVERGILDRAAVDAGLHALATEEVGPRTVVDGHLAVIGRRRG